MILSISTTSSMHLSAFLSIWKGSTESDLKRIISFRMESSDNLKSLVKPSNAFPKNCASYILKFHGKMLLE